MNENTPQESSEEKRKSPKWKEDFPIDLEQDTRIARRDFIRFLFLVSLGLFTGTTAVFTRGLSLVKKVLKPEEPVRLVGLEDLAVGESHVFQTPDDKGPAILIRLNQGHYVAYSQKCTHLQCPVIWKAKEAKLLCPCHHGAFAVESGEVLYGPPERSLPEIRLETKTDGIYFGGWVAEGAGDAL